MRHGQPVHGKAPHKDQLTPLSHAAMSDLARSFAKTKLSAMPPPTEDDEDDSSSASSMSSTGTVIPTTSQRAAPPVHWSDYFEQELYLDHHDTASHVRAKFHVYLTPSATPNAPLVVLHHGAGSSAMSFALMAKELRRCMPAVGILAVEARDHGSVVWGPDGAVDRNLAIDVLSHDLVNMILLTQAKAGWSSLPSLVLLGHSLGGAVVTETANRGLLGNKVLGYAVLDVVEGSAMEVLNHMHTYLASRPKSFASLEAAIEWHVRTRTLRNPQAARASVPSLLLQSPDGRWAWRTDLASTEPYWENWFTGLSGKFLSGRGAKLLLLAGTDRLDKELMIGQMQGALFYIHQGGIAYMIANTVQANSSSTSSPLQGTSCTKTSPKRRPRSSSSLSNATTGAHSCFPQRCRTSLHRARKSENLHAHQ
jgi:protein phosphatase methylesterase 1